MIAIETLVGALALSGITYAVCRKGDVIALRLGVMDHPDGDRKLHVRATPLVGGFAVLLPTVVMALWLAATTDLGPLFVGLAAAAALFAGIGFLDDRRHIRPSVRLVLAILIGIGVLTGIPGFAVEFFRFTFHPRALFLEFWAAPFTLLCLVGLVNALNMADGKNGLLIGMCLVWSGLLALYAPPPLLPLILALAAALAVALVFNLAGRVFLGDAGSHGLAVLFGLAAIYVHGVHFETLPADVVVLWFLVPVVDCLRLMVSRIMRGQSPFRPDRNHLHHILHAVMPWRYGLVVYLALVGAPGLLAWHEPQLTVLWAIAALGLYAILLGQRHRSRAGEAEDLPDRT